MTPEERQKFIDRHNQTQQNLGVSGGGGAPPPGSGDTGSGGSGGGDTTQAAPIDNRTDIQRAFETITGTVGSAVKGLSLGLNDPLDRATAKLFPNSAFAKQQEIYAKKQAQFEQEHPGLSLAATMAGSVIPSVVLGGANLGLPATGATIGPNIHPAIAAVGNALVRAGVGAGGAASVNDSPTGVVAGGLAGAGGAPLVNALIRHPSIPMAALGLGLGVANSSWLEPILGTNAAIASQMIPQGVKNFLTGAVNKIPQSWIGGGAGSLF